MYAYEVKGHVDLSSLGLCERKSQASSRKALTPLEDPVHGGDDSRNLV